MVAVAIGAAATSLEQYFGSSCIAATFVGHKVPAEVAAFAGHKVLAAIDASFKFTIVP